MIQVTDIHVRYSEVDRMGVVNNASYFVYFEDAARGFLTQFDTDYGDIEARGILMPVLESRCRYFEPLRFEDAVRIESRITQVTGVKVKFEFRVFVGDEEQPRAVASVLHGFVGTDFKPVNIKLLWSELFYVAKSALEPSVITW